MQKHFIPAQSNRIALTNNGTLGITFIGVGAAFSTSMFQSNIFLVKGKTHLLIDLGSKASVALHKAGLSVMDIENLIVTHSHADHIGGIEEWCLKARYIAPNIRGCARGEYKPNLFITAEYADILWNASIRGGLEHSEETRLGEKMKLNDYVNVIHGSALDGYGRPVFEVNVGEGKDVINVKLMRTNHVPDSSKGWRSAFYSVGVLIDDRVFISGDTMFDPNLVETFGKKAEVIFHDCQNFIGGVHASYEELKTLPEDLKAKMLLYHLNDGIYDQIDPRKDGFAGWTNCFRSGRYSFE